MNVSIFLAQAFGLFMIITGLFMLFRNKALHEVIDEYLKVHAATYFGGFLNVIIGILVVLAHNIWQGPFWVILVTIFGWVTLLKGLFYLFMPHSVIDKMLRACRRQKNFVGLGIINLALGVYLASVSF